MKRLIQYSLDIPTPFVGIAGTSVAVFLDKLNSVVGIVVGALTTVYLILRIRKELKK